MGIDIDAWSDDGHRQRCRPAPPPPLYRPFKTEADGLSLYLPITQMSEAGYIEVGRVLERIGIPQADFVIEYADRQRTWLAFRFTTSDFATAFRVGTSLPLQTSVP